MNENWNINASFGRYYKLPAYPTLGFKNENGWVNRDARYIGSTHYVAGLEFLPSPSLRFTLEGFYKQYDHYPVSMRNGISVANSGIEFGQIGSEPVQSTGKGRAGGVELFAQQKLTSNTYFTISYTLFESKFTGLDGLYRPSAWDNRNLVSAIFGWKLKRDWELGLKFRYAGGSPYTPFDLDASARNYLSIGEEVQDYSAFNSQRLRPFRQFDLRVDKRWNFREATFDVFIDIQNFTNFKPTGALRYTFERNEDNTDFATTDGLPVRSDGSNAIPKILEDNEGSILPSIGFIIEF